MARTKADLQRRIETLEAAMRNLLASHKDYTEWRQAGTDTEPSLEWALAIERTAEHYLNSQ